MGDSDDGEDDFEGFTLWEIVTGEESDIDLNIVVQNQKLIWQFSPEISSSSDLHRSGSGGEELLEANEAICLLFLDQARRRDGKDSQRIKGMH